MQRAIHVFVSGFFDLLLIVVILSMLHLTLTEALLVALLFRLYALEYLLEKRK